MLPNCQNEAIGAKIVSRDYEIHPGLRFQPDEGAMLRNTRIWKSDGYWMPSLDSYDTRYLLCKAVSTSYHCALGSEYPRPPICSVAATENHELDVYHGE